MSEGIVCPNCRHYNRPGWKLCDQCSFPLDANELPASNTSDVPSNKPGTPALQIIHERTRINNANLIVSYILIVGLALFSYNLFYVRPKIVHLQTQVIVLQTEID